MFPPAMRAEALCEVEIYDEREPEQGVDLHPMREVHG